MKVEKSNNKVILIAENGKQLQRKEDKMIFGKKVYLGYTYYIGGNKLDEPKLENPEDYEEVDE